MKITFNKSQILKLILFSSFYIINIILCYIFLRSLYRLFSETPLKFLDFIYLIFSGLSLLYLFVKIKKFYKRQQAGYVGSSIVLISPILGKRVLHDSGEYYVSYENNSYKLYKDRIFYKEEIESFDSNYIDDQETLSGRIKSTLDIRYSKEMKLKNKRDLLYTWDGYTSKISKRDDKINKIIN